MAEGGEVADPLAPAESPKPEDAIGSETQNPEPLKPEVKAEEQPASEADSRKRKLDDGAVDALRSSTYFKIRSIIRDLRPFFVEVINAPDFRESKAAHDIRKKMKTMIELTKQLRKEASFANPEEKPSAEAMEKMHQEIEGQVPPQPENGSVNPSSSDNGETLEIKELEKLEDEQGYQGTYVVGGSPVGWNFLLYPGGKPIYYGITKESFRSCQIAEPA